jgi:winged helix-turn-helix protein
MDIIQKRTGIKYHEVHIYRLLHKWGFASKIPMKRFVNRASQKEKKKFKIVQDVITNLKTEWHILVQDESIFLHNLHLRRNGLYDKKDQ